jgi:hypothetical protein
MKNGTPNQLHKQEGVNRPPGSGWDMKNGTPNQLHKQEGVNRPPGSRWDLTGHSSNPSVVGLVDFASHSFQEIVLARQFLCEPPANPGYSKVVEEPNPSCYGAPDKH